MTKAAQQINKHEEDTGQFNDFPVCGIIMPIADTEGYPSGHWQDVYSILKESAINANFHPNLVSFDNDIGVIQKRIIQNIYSNPIVVCDISSRNANVMFELGMRLAFDKPTIIVKDEETPYSFDISSIEHLNYPTDLRYKSINEFKDKLTEKIKKTHQRSIDDPSYSTFLRSYGSFEIVDIKEVEVPESKYIISQINEIKSLLISNATQTRLNDSNSEKSIKSIRSRNYRMRLSDNGLESLNTPYFLQDLLKNTGVLVTSVNVKDNFAEVELFGEDGMLPPLPWLLNKINNPKSPD